MKEQVAKLEKGGRFGDSRNYEKPYFKELRLKENKTEIAEPRIFDMFEISS